MSFADARGLKAFRGSRILVVDAEPASALTARSALEAAGFRVMLVRRAAEAMAVSESASIACVIVDASITVEDGSAIAVWRSLRVMFGSEVGFILLTRPSLMPSFDPEGEEFLCKPVRELDLLARVRSVLERRRLQVELNEIRSLVRAGDDDAVGRHLQEERILSFLQEELLNPLRLMDLHSKTLLRAQDIPERYQASASFVDAEIDRLKRHSENLIDLIRSDHEPLRLERAPINLESLLSEIVGEIQQRRQRSITILNNAKGEIVGDSALLRRALDELIDVAQAHAPPSATITIATTECVGGIELRIAIIGCGMEAMNEARAELLGLSPSRQGLALSFCSLVIKAHGGRLWVTDSPPDVAFHIRAPTDVVNQQG